MRAVQHPSNTRVLGAPAGWDQGQLPCVAMPITDTDIMGFQCMMSWWQPTPEELAQLNAGKRIQLCILGREHPPVEVCVEP